MPPAPYPSPRSKHLYNPLPTLKLSTIKNVSTHYQNARASSSNSIDSQIAKVKYSSTSTREIELDGEDDDEDEELEVENSLLRFSQSSSTSTRDMGSIGSHDIPMSANEIARLNSEDLVAIAKQIPTIRRSRLPTALLSTPLVSNQHLVNSTETSHFSSDSAPSKRSRLPQTQTSTTSSSQTQSSGNIQIHFLTICDTCSDTADGDASPQKRLKLDLVETDLPSEINANVLPSTKTSLSVVAPSQQLKPRTSLVANLKPKTSRLPPRIPSTSFPSPPSVHPVPSSVIAHISSPISIPVVIPNEVKQRGSATKSASRTLIASLPYVQPAPAPTPLDLISSSSRLNVSTSQSIISSSPTQLQSIVAASSNVSPLPIHDQSSSIPVNLSRGNGARKSAPTQPPRLGSAKKSAPRPMKARKSAPSSIHLEDDSVNTEIEDGKEEVEDSSSEEQQEEPNSKSVESIPTTNFYQSANSFDPFKGSNMAINTTATGTSNINTTSITFPSTVRAATISISDEFRVIPHPSDPEYISLSTNNQPYIASTKFPVGQVIPKRPESKYPLLRQSSEIEILQNSIKSNNSSRTGTPIPAYISRSSHRARSFTNGSTSDESDDSTIYKSNKEENNVREVSTSASVSGIEATDGMLVNKQVIMKRQLVGNDLSVEDELSTTLHDQSFHIDIDSIQIPSSDIPRSIREAGYMVLRLVFSLSLPLDEDDPEELDGTNYDISDTSIIAAQFHLAPSDGSNSLTILIPQKPLFCDLNLFPNSRYNRDITDLDFRIKACFPEIGNVLNSSTTFSTFNISTRIISSGRFIDSLSSTILYSFIENAGDNETKGEVPGVYLSWKKTLINRNSAQQDEELVRKVEELILQDSKVWLPEGIKMKRQLGWSRRPGKGGKGKKLRHKVMDLGPFKRTYSTLTREPEVPASHSRWEDDDNYRSSAALIRETDQILATLLISAPYLSTPESVIITKLHSRFVRINGYPRSIVEREISTWSYYAPVLLHHFHASRELYPGFTTGERVKLSIGLFLRTFTKCNLLNQQTYLEVIQSFSTRVDSIELTGEAGGEEFLKMRKSQGGW